jgi:hypothetical protein
MASLGFCSTFLRTGKKSEYVSDRKMCFAFRLSSRILILLFLFPLP